LKAAQKATEPIHGMSGYIKWFNRDPSRSNQHCLYCGSHVGEDSAIASDEEHLVGRNFVPKGTMGNAFNFSFRACRPCNARKANLERHVSSVTLLNSPSVASDGIARRAAERKAVGDTHPETRVKMGDAIARQTAEFSFGPASFNFGLSGPSPAAKNYIPELASYHIQALFTLVTTPESRTPENVRLLPLDRFRVFGSYPHSDWGNLQLVEIGKRAASWPCRVAILTAGGFFRACLRRHESDGWFWALEWNKSLRVVGGIHLPEENNPLFENLPALDWKPLPDGSGFFRREQGHPAHGDILFPKNLRADSSGKTMAD
jgi:hypothetical protein